MPVRSFFYPTWMFSLLGNESTQALRAKLANSKERRAGTPQPSWAE